MGESGIKKSDIIPVELTLPLGMGNVNCYLIGTPTGFILVDTGFPTRRKGLERKMQESGCTPDNLKLIVLTHGDIDHTGNAAYLRKKYNAPIAMHQDDFGIVEYGDMFMNRKTGNAVLRASAKLIFRLIGFKRFEPDINMEEGFDFKEFGLDATALHLPGHSKGSIGILTGEGELICGDLFSNRTTVPELNPIMDELRTAVGSVDKLKNLAITTVYPGHGKPFTMHSYLEKRPAYRGYRHPPDGKPL